MSHSVDQQANIEPEDKLKSLENYKLEKHINLEDLVASITDAFDISEDEVLRALEENGIIKERLVPKRKTMYDIVIPNGFTLSSDIRFLKNQEGANGLINTLIRAGLETFESISHITILEAETYIRNFRRGKAGAVRKLLNQLGTDFLSEDARTASGLSTQIFGKLILPLATLEIYDLQSFLDLDLDDSRITDYTKQKLIELQQALKSEA